MDQFICLGFLFERSSSGKSKRNVELCSFVMVGHKWYQSPALALLFRRLYFSLFKGTLSYEEEKTGFSV
jgi:hypothetical protein